jgi:hypothetical protein
MTFGFEGDDVDAIEAMRNLLVVRNRVGVGQPETQGREVEER